MWRSLHFVYIQNRFQPVILSHRSSELHVQLKLDKNCTHVINALGFISESHCYQIPNNYLPLWHLQGLVTRDLGNEGHSPGFHGGKWQIWREVYSQESEINSGWPTCIAVGPEFSVMLNQTDRATHQPEKFFQSVSRCNTTTVLSFCLNRGCLETISACGISVTKLCWFHVIEIQFRATHQGQLLNLYRFPRKSIEPHNSILTKWKYWQNLIYNAGFK